MAGIGKGKHNAAQIRMSACIFSVKRYHPAMNSKHRKTLEAIFADPISGNLPWDRIEALLVAIGCTAVEGSGSSVTFEKAGKRAYFHRPHPQREALMYRVKAVREFLIKLGVTA